MSLLGLIFVVPWIFRFLYVPEKWLQPVLGVTLLQIYWQLLCQLRFESPRHKRTNYDVMEKRLERLRTEKAVHSLHRHVERYVELQEVVKNGYPKVRRQL